MIAPSAPLLVGRRVVLAESNDHTPGNDLFCSGWVRELSAPSDEDDSDVGEPTYVIEFDDVDRDDEHWRIEEIIKANLFEMKLQSLFKDGNTKYLKERVACNGWFGVVVEKLASNMWKIVYDDGDDNQKETHLTTETVEEGVRFFRALKGIYEDVLLKPAPI